MYNIEVKEPGGSAFKGGLNDNVSLHSIELVRVETTRYEGPAIDVVFEKDGTFLTCRQFPLDLSRVKIKNTKDKTIGELRQESQEEAETRAKGEYVLWFKSLINVNFCTPEQWSKAIAEATSFEKLFTALVSLLPDDYQERKGQLICTVSDNNYVEVPRFHWITRAFFSLGEKPLNVDMRYVRVNPITIVPPAADTPSQEGDEADPWV